MKRMAALCCLVLLLKACGGVAVQPEPEILGVRLGMNEEAAHARLQKLGRKLEREERKQQEIWNLTDDPRYSYLMLAFNKERTEVRYVTAKARDNGTRVRYSEVMDLAKAKKISTANNTKYILEVPAQGNHPGYTIIAQGHDPDYLTYFSIKNKDIEEEEEEKD